MKLGCFIYFLLILTIIITQGICGTNSTATYRYISGFFIQPISFPGSFDPNILKWSLSLFLRGRDI